jgi:hypothetical protein
MVKEALEDFRRYQADRDVNNRKVEVYNVATGRFEKRAWRNLQARSHHPCPTVKPQFERRAETTKHSDNASASTGPWENAPVCTSAHSGFFLGAPSCQPFLGPI